MDPPTDPAAFVHRIGRTARAGQSGKALVLLLPHEARDRSARPDRPDRIAERTAQRTARTGRSASSMRRGFGVQRRVLLKTVSSGTFLDRLPRTFHSAGKQAPPSCALRSLHAPKNPPQCAPTKIEPPTAQPTESPPPSHPRAGGWVFALLGEAWHPTGAAS